MAEENKKKWYKTWWGILFIILLFPLFLMFLASRWIWRQNWKTEYRVGAIAALWGVVLLLGAISEATEPKPVATQSVAQTASQPTTPPTNTPVKKYQYEIKRHEKKTNLENLDVLIKPGEPDPEGLAKEIQSNCKSPCNIYLFDDEKALNLQLAYDGMDIEERNDWRKNNYVYVADHVVGNISFELPDSYNEYPFRDWQYRELGGTQ